MLRFNEFVCQQQQQKKSIKIRRKCTVVFVAVNNTIITWFSIKNTIWNESLCIYVWNHCYHDQLKKCNFDNSI